MINIPTELLRTLIAVADLRSFTKAAQALGVTQPAVSAQIKRLQLLLDCELFDKSAPGVTLTPSGELVLEQARRMLKINDRIVDMSAPRGVTKPLRIGVTGDFSAPLLPPLLAKFWMSHPELRFVVQCHPFEFMSRALLQGEVDMFVGVSESEIGLEARHEWKEPMVWLRGPGFQPDPVAPVSLVTFGEGCAFHRVAAMALNSVQRPFEVVFKGPSEATIMEAVRSGLGVGVAPRSRVALTGCEVCSDSMLPQMRDLFCGIYLGDHEERLALEQLADALFEEFQSKLPQTMLRSYAF